MVPPSQGLQAEGKQFRLPKFFAYTSFIVFIIFSFPFSVVISQQAKDILMKSYENYALLLGENLNHQVFQNFVLPVSRIYGKIRLREKDQYEWMDQIVRSTIHSFNIDMVNIYDIGEGVIAYSTDSRLLGKKVEKSLGYLNAVEGKNSSRIISGGDDLWGLEIEKIGGKKKLRTYIPFIGVVKPVDAVEKAGLARTVGADNGKDLPLLHPGRHAVQGHEPAEAEVNILHKKLVLFVMFHLTIRICQQKRIRATQISRAKAQRDYV